MYTGADQCSHFEEIAAPLSIRLDAQRLLSPALPVKQSVFLFAATFSMGWHITDHRAYYVYLQGRQEVDTGAASRIFGPGDVLLAEDTALVVVTRRLDHRACARVKLESVRI